MKQLLLLFVLGILLISCETDSMYSQSNYTIKKDSINYRISYRSTFENKQLYIIDENHYKKPDTLVNSNSNRGGDFDLKLKYKGDYQIKIVQCCAPTDYKYSEIYIINLDTGDTIDKHISDKCMNSYNLDLKPY